MPERLLPSPPAAPAAGGGAPCWPAQQSARRTLLLVAPERRWLAVGLLLLLLVAGVLLMLLLLPGATDQPPQLSCERHAADMGVSPLPPLPDSDQAMFQALFSYLAEPAPDTCQRDLAIGAHVIHPAGSDNAMLWGGRHLCFDPEFSLVDERCLVYSVRQPEDASFDVAADAFGCETHSFGPEARPGAEPLLGRPVSVRHHRETETGPDAGPETGPDAGRLDGWVRHLGHGRRHISVLSLALDTAGFSRFLEESPRALVGNVRQLSVRLDARAVTQAGLVGPAGHDLAALRRLYRGLIRLQQLGFYPFASDFLDGLETGEFRVSGVAVPVKRVMEVAWVRTACL